MGLKSFTTALFSLFISLSITAQKTDTIPWNGEQLNKQGITHFDKGEYAEALKFFNRVSKCDPEYATACYEAALTFENTEEYTLGLNKINEADSIEPDNVRFITLKGSLLDDLKRYSEAIELLEAARKKWPYNHNLLYNLAIVYINAENYNKAELTLNECVKISPYHSGTHILLGRLNYILGRMGESVLAYNMGLLLNPSMSNVTKFQNVITGEATPSSKAYLYPYPEGYDAEQWKEITRLCNSGLAFNNNFPYKLKPNFLLNRQSYLVFQKMQYNAEDATIYNQFYVRFFKELFYRNELDILFGLQLQNIKDDAVNALNNANAKRIKKFVEFAQTSIGNWREYGFSSINEKNKVKTHIFDDNGNLSMIGTQVLVPEPSIEGNYIRINRAGAVIEKGTYKNNKQEGLCEILYPDGSISQELYFTADELDKTNRTFYENGNLSGIYPRDKGKKNGTEINYSKSGRVTRKQSFENDKVEGSHYQLFMSQAWSFEQSYTNDKLNGVYTQKWINGNLKEQGNYTDSLLNGACKQWYANGKLKEETNFLKDKLSGTYTLYHTNGIKSEEGVYNDSAQLHGVVIRYDRTGKKIKSKTNYENGKLNGLTTFYYDNGKIKFEHNYLNNTLEKITCYNQTGNVIYQTEAKDGEIQFKGFYDDGMLLNEGSLRNGKQEGEWWAFSGGGVLISIENYKDGMESGIQKTFYPSGTLKSENVCDSNKIEGVLKNYFPNGTLKSIAYYQNGSANGEHKVYNSNGNLKGHYYLSENNVTGTSFEYCTEGKLTTVIGYDEDNNIKNAVIYANGKFEKQIPYDKDSLLVQFYYPSGKLKLWFKLVDGLKEGVSETYYPNGKIQSKVNFLYGKLNGPALNWDIDGNLESTANYVLDKPEGFIYYYNKGKISALDYFEDGKNQNTYRELYSNGKTYRIIPNVDDSREGEYQFFSPDSVLLFSLNYQNEFITSVKIRNKQGVIEKIPATENKSGQLTSYYPNGAIAANIPVLNGYLNGIMVLYQANGLKIIERNYVNDYLEGITNKYHINGKLKETMVYHNDDLDGKWTQYSESGVKMIEGQFSADAKTGVWIYYDAAGKEKYKVLYENDLVYDFL